ncbi:MAG TPA: hypothetical protein DD381_01690 [Lentisphaeria bacterium]|nr:MAG: hypothetical protein A2X47_10340 [Lentisphaerae bacterium GWF2_38_69]HBM15054.1 hypothetical protein [Lentisphaeria bacterium]
MTDYQVGDIIHFINTYPNPYGAPLEQDVRMHNSATASLYRYTPQGYNGDCNFWKLTINGLNKSFFNLQFECLTVFLEVAHVLS